MPSLSPRPDVTIVGGGGIGASVAYFLARNSDLRVRVYEADPSYAHAATALAAGGIRQMFSTIENIRMSQFGVAFLRTAAAELAVGREAPQLGYRAQPYMRLTPASARDVVEAQVELQIAAGAQPQLLEVVELRQRFPWLNTEDVGCAVLGGGGEGIFDPYALLQALRRKGSALGVEFVAAEVVGFERARGGAITAILLNDGSRAASGVVVNAAGPRARAVSAMVGIDLPVIPMKATTFVFRAEASPVDCPTVLDQVSGLNFRPEGELFIVGWSGAAGEARAGDFDVDYEAFDEIVWPRLARRTPRFEAIKLVRGWAGHIELNRFDCNPILGLHPESPNLLFANGFSGHGAQHVPAAGRAIAELILYGEYRSLDLGRLGWARLLENEPLLEAL